MNSSLSSPPGFGLGWDCRLALGPAMTYAFDSFGSRIDESELDDVLLFVLGGEFDAYSAPGLEERLTEAIDRGRYEIVVDLSEVTFVDMSTLNAIVRAIK